MVGNVSWLGRSTASGSHRSISSHRQDIDGLRAVAVLSVLAFHAKVPGFSGGFTGVDVFFVISGYLICSILVREIEQGTFSIARFYERRCKRILPALFAVLIFCMVLSLFVLSPIEARHLGSGVMATALSVSNVQFYLKGNYFDREGILNPLLMTWSLAVEEQFYIVFPLIMLMLYKRSRRHLFAIMVIGCFLSFGFSCYCEFRHPGFNFYLPFTRAWELGAGTLFAIWQARAPSQAQRPQWQHEVLASLGLLMIIGCVIAYSPSTRFPGYEALPPVLGTLFLLSSQGFANRLLGLPALTAVGLISYSLYLWHWPILSFAAIIAPEALAPHVRVNLLLLAAGLATLSYFFIETPFRTARYANRTRMLAGYAFLIVCAFLAGLAFVETNGFARRTPEIAKIEDSLELDRVHGCINSSERGPIVSSDCVPPSSDKPIVALLGDSHAEAIENTLRQKVNAAGQQLLVLTSYSCPPLLGFTRTLADEPIHARACADFNSQALRIIQSRADVKVVVLLGSWPMVQADKFVPDSYLGDPGSLSLEQSRKNLLQGLHAEISELEKSGKKVILVDDWPSLTFNPIDHERYALMPVRRFISDHLLAQPVSNALATQEARGVTISGSAEDLRIELLALTQSDPELVFMDTKEKVCNQQACDLVTGGHILYSDGNHMDHFGAEEILSGLKIPVPK